MRKHIAKMLSLQGIFIKSLITTEEEVTVLIRSPRTSAICPCCKNNSKRIHQRHTRIVHHSELDGRPVVLKVAYRRFMCKTCCRPFTESIPGIDRRQTTHHGRKETVRRLAKQNFVNTADELGVSPTTVTRTLQEAYNQHTIDWQAQGESFAIGIDGHSFRGFDMAGTITNLTKKKLLTILTDDGQETTREFFKSIPAQTKERITEVCMDMDSGCRSVTEEQLPQAKIVIDHYHVIAATNQLMDNIRQVTLHGSNWQPKIRRLLFKNKETLTKEEYTKLMQVFAYYRKFPSLEIAWKAKELLRDMYRLQDKKRAELKLKHVLAFLTGTESSYLKQIRGMLIRWKPYILNFFDHRTTNAFTEGVHTKIKMTKRLSYGFRNRRNYLAKMTLAFIPFALSFSPHLLT